MESSNFDEIRLFGRRLTLIRRLELGHLRRLICVERFGKLQNSLINCRRPRANFPLAAELSCPKLEMKTKKSAKMGKRKVEPDVHELSPGFEMRWKLV